MADALYLMLLRLTDKVTKFMNKDEKKVVKTAAFFKSVCYAPWFLKSYLVGNSPSKDLAASRVFFASWINIPSLGPQSLPVCKDITGT